MFRIGRRYRHQRCLDVDILVDKVVWWGPEYIRVKIRWVNRNGEYVIGSDNVKIQRKDFSLWREIE